MYNVSENAVPTQYPLALSGLGDINSANYVAFEWNVLQRDYGKNSDIVTPQDRQDMFAAFDDNNTLAAATVVQRIKGRIRNATMPPKPSKVPAFVDKLAPDAELLPGVRNIYMYAGLTLFVLSRFFKKGS